MTKIVILLALFCSFSQIIPSTSGEVVMCYHGTWARYRTGNGQYLLTDLANSASYCTHWIYTFMGINTNGSMVSLDTWLDFNLDNLNQFNALKSSACNVKTLLAIGGWNEGSLKYSTVMANSTLRAIFVKSVLHWVQTYGFDGFDLDWEYPAQRGGATADKENFITLIKELREAFDPYNLILTAAVAATGTAADISYDVASMSQYLDYINIMTYDFHVASEGVTGHNAPLYASSIDTDANLNINASINAWISRGANASKLVLGLPTYGRTFTLSDSSNVVLGAAASTTGGTAGTYTQTAGFLGYNEILEKFAEGGWTVVWDDEQHVPHAHKDGQWIGYDNPKAIALKVNYANSYGLGGVMIWSIETDDFKGVNGDSYPILSAIKSAYDALNVTLHGSCSTSSSSTSSSNSSTNSTSSDSSSSSASSDSSSSSASSSSSNSSSSDSSSSSTNSTSSDSTSSSSSSNVVTSSVSGSYQITCSAAGFFRESSNCQVFYQCTAAGVTTTGISCVSGLYFDLSSNTCNWASLVTDCSS